MVVDGCFYERNISASNAMFLGEVELTADFLWKARVDLYRHCSFKF